ncbi:MAG: hypothetical protein K2V38_15765 [Gemmataceae bacterium]|nr:hypothetical protein [Gemmataceae bacterium]
MTTDRARRVAAALALSALLALTAAGCGGPATGDVSGVVKVDGQTPAEGSSITFVSADGKTAGGGALITDGKYNVKLATGNYKVEVRAPRTLKGAKTAPAGDGPQPGGPGSGGPGGPANIEESLPAKYNDKTELTYEVKAGGQEKNWELTTK